MNSETPRDETKGRRSYVMYLTGIFIGLPIAANIIGNAIGWDFSGLSHIAKINEEGTQIAHGVKLDFLSVWYISIPLFIWVTYRRVSDTSINVWLTPLFLLPFVNFLLWFWPPRKMAHSE